MPTNMSLANLQKKLTINANSLDYIKKGIVG